ncbi:MAG: acylphosphatase [Lachnospiraceae bacterium]|nr:acylphosphatase [Lachnospiraceae bacterium]
MPDDIVRKRIRFSGRVQGVGFRYRSTMLATEIGLTGWVKNEYDGSVTMEVQGRENQIDMLIDKLYSSRFISIDDFDSERIDVDYHEGSFNIIGF